MKGTIDANIENAEQKILTDRKESAEHNTIVDLIRNDLNMVAKNVRVINFKYIDKITTNYKNLYCKSVQKLQPIYQKIIRNISVQSSRNYCLQVQ